MKKVLRCVLSTIASLILVAAVCALPVTFPNTTATHEQTTAAQSVSGKIAEVRKNSFTLSIGPSPTRSNMGQELQDLMERSMTFEIDKNTTVDGKLQVGAKAEVTYRDEGGNHVAINVRVS